MFSVRLDNCYQRRSATASFEMYVGSGVAAGKWRAAVAFRCSGVSALSMRLRLAMFAGLEADIARCPASLRRAKSKLSGCSGVEQLQEQTAS